MASQAPYRDTLVVHFVGDLLQHTMDASTAAAHQHALQAFLEALSPWVLPHELPTLLGPAFTLFDACALTPTADGTNEDVAVALSPQGEVVFRAWLRRRGVDPLVCSS
jgi:hypothetical protein